MKKLQIEINLPYLEDNRYNRDLLLKIETKKTIESHKYIASATGRITIDSDKDFLSDPNLLIKDLNEFKLKIIEIVAFGHFYAQINTPEYQENVNSIKISLNSSGYKLKPISANDRFVGKLIATLFIESADEINISRAKIIKVFDSCVEVL